MSQTSYLGGVCRRGHAPAPTSVQEQWGWVGQGTELFVRSAPACSRLFAWDGLALLLRGYARPSGSTSPLDLERIATGIRDRYLETGELDADGLEGSFTLALLDSRAERVVLYRNLIGTGSTYYRSTAQGLLFGGNLPELLALAGDASPARDVLPDFFLFRCVPGRRTLFQGIDRLLPGEEVSWDRDGLRRRQRHTFADLAGARLRDGEAIERTDETLAAILRDQAAHRPGVANLLSGGVDSSYIQAVFNQEVHPGEELPPSYSIAVDHPMTWLDTDYAITASQGIGTRHMLAAADGPYAAYMQDALATTGEPLNHVQSAYFGHLARFMARDGATAGLCGEGADSLFGLGLANKLHNARFLERLVPVPALRRLAGSALGALGCSGLASAFRLAGRRSDYAALDHPVNNAAVFTDIGAAAACFGTDAVAEAFARRRALLDAFDVPDDPQDRIHAVGFLGEAIDSAGLWATLFQRAGVDLLCPFLDSRMLRLSFSLPATSRYRFRRPKDVLKRGLARRAPREIATRVKLGFGQPVFEWLAPGGQLASLAERIGGHAFLKGDVMDRLRQEPSWFLYSALVYDQWHRLFVERSLPMPSGKTPSRRTMAKT